MQNFLACVKSRQEKDLHDPVANAVPSADLCHLANISYRTGHKLQWDNAHRRFVNDPEADKLMTRNPYRKPYVV